MKDMQILKKLIQLSFPLILAGLIQASVGFFATLFLARYGTTELAAGAIVSWLFTTLMVIVWGTLSSISVLTSINHGKQDDVSVSFVLRDGTILAIIFSILAIVLFLYTPHFLHLINQQKNVIDLASQYIDGLIWGIPADFLALVLLQWLIGLSRVKVNLVYALFLVPLNIFCNYVFLFGKWGFPHWGIAGMGWGTTFTFWLTTLGLFGYLVSSKNYRHYFISALSSRSPHFVSSLCKIGIPTGLMFSLQVAFFLVITLLMGHYGVVYLAANQITLQYGWLSFVVLYAIAQAVTVQVGHEFGKQQFFAIKEICYFAIIFVLLLIGLISLCFWFIPTVLINLDLDLTNPNNAAIAIYAKQFLALAGIFQLLEAIRIIFFGVLRGLKDTHFSFWNSLISFWGIALPLGYLLALKWEGIGLWWGITLSGFFSAGASAIYVFWLIRRIRCPLSDG